MNKKEWTDLNVYKLLCKIDDGYEPNAEEAAILNSREKLYLSDLSITFLPKSIEKLTNLKSLSLSRNKITSLPANIGSLKHLEELGIGGTRITELPSSFAGLKELRGLYFWGTQISILPDLIGQFSELQRLDISLVQIKTVPEWIRNLKKLEFLSLTSTQITVLPDWIGDLPALRTIRLDGLSLPEIPRSLALRGLPFIDRKYIIRDESCINLYNTVLTKQSKSIFLEHPELIPGLYEDKEQITLRECRVIFLGDGDSGKSYTIQRFRKEGKKESKNNPYPTRETPGVEILDYHADRGAESFDIHFWDFGGQQLLHAMHRCFLTEQTCYVVTVKSRETKADQRVRYWLRNVTAFAPNSPILVYVNCWENDNGKRVLDERRLRRDFPKIVDVVYVSAKEAADETFRTGLMEPILDMAAASDGCKQLVNQNWITVRRAIDAERKEKPYLDKARYHALCAANQIENDNAPALLSFFNSLGVCFSYHRDAEKKELADYKLLSPVWLTNALYAIIEEGMDLVDEGKISMKGVQKILCQKHAKGEADAALRRTVPGIVYQTAECPYIIDIAVLHNLCYRIDDNTLFFPALCSTDSPEEALEEPEDRIRCVEYRMKYEYLPDSIVHRLMIRCKQQHFDIHCWLRGMILEDTDGHKAIVRMDDNDETLILSLRSEPGHSAYTLFLWLRSELLKINDAMELTAEEIIVDGEDQYSINLLFTAMEDNDTVRGNKTGKKHDPGELLGQFYENENPNLIKVDNGAIQISILPYKYHKHSKDDPDLRQALYEAYKGICPYCANRIPNVLDIQVDHILPKHSQHLPELDSYIKYIKERGFDEEKPDYIENYFPTHPHCNNAKRDQTVASLVFWHMLAAQKASKVLELMQTYKQGRRERGKTVQSQQVDEKE